MPQFIQLKNRVTINLEAVASVEWNVNTHGQTQDIVRLSSGLSYAVEVGTPESQKIRERLAYID